MNGQATWASRVASTRAWELLPRRASTPVIWLSTGKLVSALHALGGNGRGPVALGRVKPSLAPVRNEMLNASGSRRIMQENLVKATERDRRWYATTVKNVLDRAGDQQVREAA